MSVDPSPALATSRRGHVRAAVLLGIGTAGTFDEVVFHQLLGWHHLYDRASLSLALLSDGILHMVSTGALVAGFVLLLRSARTTGTLGDRRTLTGGWLAGLGGFNLYDGMVNHKLLGLHQIRPAAPEQLPYDVAWNVSAAALLVAGLLLLRRSRQSNGG